MICYQLWTSRSPFQSRCRDMLTVNVKKSRKETMHISWKHAWHCRFQHWHLKFMLFSTLKPGGWGSPDRSAGVWYRCTGSFCFNPSGPSQYMTLNNTWLLFKVRTCLWCMRTSPRIRLEAPQKRLWGASEAPQRRLRGAASAQRSSKSSAPLN